MTTKQQNLFRAYNITVPWAQEFGYNLELAQWSFEDVLMKPMSSQDIPWTVAKTLLGMGAKNKGTILYNTTIIQDYSRACAFISTLRKINLSVEKFVGIATHGNIKWAVPYLEQKDDITVLRRNGHNEYCVLMPADKCNTLLGPMLDSFDLRAVLESFNPTIKNA